ncbi:hypothetical protein Taro_022448, partial [Colocasia esculenta]|nr:hypothetical protein [Colocasia esculenta]
ESQLFTTLRFQRFHPGEFFSSTRSSSSAVFQVRSSQMAICSSSCCWVPPARGPQSSLRTPSLSLAPAITLLSLPKPVPRSLRGVAAGPKWRLEPLPRTPHHRHACACAAGSSETGGAPNPFPCNRIFVKVKIVTSKTTKQSLGFAYVWFASGEDAQLAVKEMNGKVYLYNPHWLQNECHGCQLNMDPSFQGL